jgi:hypothetical protein
MRLRLLMEDLHEVCYRDEPLQRLNVPCAELVVDHKPEVTKVAPLAPKLPLAVGFQIEGDGCIYSLLIFGSEGI